MSEVSTAFLEFSGRIVDLKKVTYAIRRKNEKEKINETHLHFGSSEVVVLVGEEAEIAWSALSALSLQMVKG